MSSFEGRFYETETSFPQARAAQRPDRALTRARIRTHVTAARRPFSAPGALVLSGVVMLVGYVALFTLLLSRTLWESPTLVPDRWKQVFNPLKHLFPWSWLMAKRGTELGLLNVALYLLIIGVLFAAYFYVLKALFRPGAVRAHQTRMLFAGILAFSTVCVALLMLTAGTLSQDLFSYIWYGRIFAVYGENPLIHTPAEYAWSDPTRWIQWVYWKYTPSVYGPVWLMLAGAIAAIAQSIDGDIVTHLLGHKLLAGAAHLFNIWLLWQVSRPFIERYWPVPRTLSHAIGGEAYDTAVADWHSGMRVAVTAAYAWNPLALVEFAVSGHNDVLLITGVLAALWLHLSGRWRLAVLCLALASMVKVIALILLPGYLWLLMWETGGRGTSRGNDSDSVSRGVLGAQLWRVAQALALFAIAWVVCYIPFWDGPATLRPLLSGPATQYYIHSLGAIIRFRLPEAVSSLAMALDWQPARFWTADAIGWRIDWPTRWGLLAITAAVAVLQTWRARTPGAMLMAWGWTLFAYLTIGSVWYWPWYATWLLVPAALVGPGRLFTATQILCASSLLMYAIYPTVAEPFTPLSEWTGLIIMAPPLGYVLASVWREARAGRVWAGAARQTTSPA